MTNKRRVLARGCELQMLLAMLDNGHEYIRVIYGAGYKYEHREKLLH
ncbi:MAG: hypothetical protein HRU20_23580 [Pseudomonadales bacterium]|nr:hypothetical protein [Pseudomonadales bacterium]